MNLIKNDPALETVAISPEDLLKQKIEMMLEAYRLGQISIDPVQEYQGQLSEKDCIIYRVKFLRPQDITEDQETGDRVDVSDLQPFAIIYDGAFQMPVALANKLLDETKLIPYILFQLINELQ